VGGTHKVMTALIPLMFVCLFLELTKMLTFKCFCGFFFLCNLIDAISQSVDASGTISNLRSYNMLSGGLPPNFTQTSMGIYNSVGVRNYGALDTSGNLPITSTIHNVLGTSGIPGLAATGGSGLHGDIRSSFHDQRREFFASMQQDLHMVKREDVSHCCYTGL
jgi:hypothetical protein